MSKAKPQLLAAYFTLAGDVYPGGPTEVSPYPIEERARVAHAAGWRGMGLVHADLMASAKRLGMQGLKRVLSDQGIEHVEVEFLENWYLDAGDPRRKTSDRVRQELLELATVLGARNIKISPELFVDGKPVTPPDVPRLRDEFASLCEQARPTGANVAIEMMPFTNLNTIDAVMPVIAGADQPNGGLYLDIWHLVRGGMPYSEIAKVPARFLKGIELDDAPATYSGSIFDDTRFGRCLPGEGSFDLPAFIRNVVATGVDAPSYAVEMLSATHRKKPLEVMARTAYEATMRVIDTVDA
jgi:sugar phosphate isomerase/epimerase